MLPIWGWVARWCYINVESKMGIYHIYTFHIQAKEVYPGFSTRFLKPSHLMYSRPRKKLFGFSFCRFILFIGQNSRIYLMFYIYTIECTLRTAILVKALWNTLTSFVFICCCLFSFFFEGTLSNGKG